MCRPYCRSQRHMWEGAMFRSKTCSYHRRTPAQAFSFLLCYGVCRSVGAGCVCCLSPRGGAVSAGRRRLLRPNLPDSFCYRQSTCARSLPSHFYLLRYDHVFLCGECGEIQGIAGLQCGGRKKKPLVACCTLSDMLLQRDPPNRTCKGRFRAHHYPRKVLGNMYRLLNQMYHIISAHHIQV